MQIVLTGCAREPHSLQAVSGSTIAAAEAVGYDSIGVELDDEYFKLAGHAIPRLAKLYPDFTGQELQMNGEYGSIERDDVGQLAMVLEEKAVTYKTKPVSKARRNSSRT